MCGSWKIVAALVTTVCLSAAVHQDEPEAYVGQWERNWAGHYTSITLTKNHRFHLLVRGRLLHSGGNHIFTLYGDYHVTHDDILYGVVTSVENSLESDDPEPIEDTDRFSWPFNEVEEELIDRPFRFRFRVDGNTLAIHGCYGLGKKEPATNKRLFGHFKKIDLHPAPASPYNIP